MKIHKLERFLSNHKYIIITIGVCISFLRYMNFNLDVPTFFNQLDTIKQILFVGFMNFLLIIFASILIKNYVDNQPLYRYTRLGEAGKKLILTAKGGASINLNNFLEDKFQFDELKKQARISEDYGWITLDENIAKITKEGETDLETFVDLVYGRYR